MLKGLLYVLVFGILWFFPLRDFGSVCNSFPVIDHPLPLVCVLFSLSSPLLLFSTFKPTTHIGRGAMLFDFLWFLVISFAGLWFCMHQSLVTVYPLPLFIFCSRIIFSFLYYSKISFQTYFPT